MYASPSNIPSSSVAKVTEKETIIGNEFFSGIIGFVTCTRSQLEIIEFATTRGIHCTAPKQSLKVSVQDLQNCNLSRGRSEAQALWMLPSRIISEDYARSVSGPTIANYFMTNIPARFCQMTR